MLAFKLERYDGPSALTLTEVPDLEPAPGRVLVDVRAIGVNFPDLLATRGEYQHRPPLPLVPGCEIAGDVVAAGADSGFGPGDRVAAFTWDSGYAERALVDPAGAVRLPAEVSYRCEGDARIVDSKGDRQLPDTNAVDLEVSSNGDRLFYMVDGTQTSITL